jgi:hypothetical protein
MHEICKDVNTINHEVRCNKISEELESGSNFFKHGNPGGYRVVIL